jgi:hypothetical protein
MAQSFYLMGGQYELYVHAQAYGVVPSPSDSPCIFGGVLGRIAPSTYNSTPVTRSTWVRTPRE